jgi:hypothetical protein
MELAIKYEEANESTPAMIKCGVRFIERTEISIGNTKVIKEPGDCIRVIKSQRFGKDMFGKIADKAGFNMKYQKSHNGVAIAVLQSKL